ncbi:hypothetical protein CERZMDRAFT_88424 [Cercospora zeae-maydis SCOH1-5]|uniref:Mid2 domain-containing protein n=1 Tax=Cercospora zeae-maydis SCOH1-5 TaxID=717836 RepID=A0A6A6F4W7_9PEZI|nr:hypothetical protein CERZMDRAFT_88424 [Cercospora zeae-maydis SCOH1-5]
MPSLGLMKAEAASTFAVPSTTPRPVDTITEDNPSDRPIDTIIEDSTTETSDIFSITSIDTSTVSSSESTWWFSPIWITSEWETFTVTGSFTETYIPGATEESSVHTVVTGKPTPSSASGAPQATTPSNLAETVSNHATAAIAISVGTTFPIFLGILVVWYLARRKRNAKMLDYEKPGRGMTGATETDTSPISELFEVKGAREAEDTSIVEMQVPSVELEGDSPARMAEEPVEAKTWFSETLDAVLSTD